MKQIQSDLWETEAEYPAPGLSTHAYLWTGSNEGNVLFYNTTHTHELDRIGELGGLARQYLSHQDEIAPSLQAIKDRFNSTLHGHRVEADIVARTTPVDVAFEEHHTDDYGIEVIPAPGHTPGSTCYLVTSTEGTTYLFTGDSIFHGTDDTWRAGYIPSFSDKDSLAKSLGDLATLTPDVVISSAFTGGAGVHELGARVWADCVEEALAQLIA